MQIIGNMAQLTQLEQHALNEAEPLTNIAKLKCDQALVDAQYVYEALKRGEEPMAYLPAELLERGVVSRGVILFTARRRLAAVTNVAAQVLSYEAEQFLQTRAIDAACDAQPLIEETEQFLQDRANGTGLDDF